MMVGVAPVENVVVHTEGGGNFVGGGRAVQRCRKECREGLGLQSMLREMELDASLELSTDLFVRQGARIYQRARTCAIWR